MCSSVSVLTVFAEFAAFAVLAVFSVFAVFAVFAGGSRSALEGEGQPSRAGVEPAGCFNRARGLFQTREEGILSCL